MSSKRNEMTQSKIGNFFVKVDEARVSARRSCSKGKVIVEDNADVVPASPVDTSKSRFGLGGRSNLRLLSKNAKSPVSSRTGDGVDNSQNESNTLIRKSSNLRKKKSPFTHLTSQCESSKGSGKYQADNRNGNGGLSSESTEIGLKAARATPISNASGSRKVTVRGQRVKRLSIAESSGLSPMKKKLVLSRGSRQEEKTARTITQDLMGLDEEDLINGVEKCVDLPNIADEDRSLGSLKVSKKGGEKLSMFTNKQTRARLKHSSETSASKANDFNDQDTCDDFISGYLTDKHDSKMDKRTPNRIDSCSGDSLNRKCGSLTQRRKKSFDSDMLDNNHGNTVCFNTSDDSFTELFKDEVFPSMEETKPQANHVHLKDEEIDAGRPANGEIDFNDSFLHIDFDDDIDLPSESCAQRQASPGNEAIFTVKPRLVLEVLRRETENQSKMFEKTLRLFDEEASQETVCILREDWEAMEVLPGDLVHITGTRSGEETTVILDNDGEQHLVLFPHTLVSGTTISMGITCQRRAVLAEMFKTDGPNAVMILGTFLHELFDFVIRDRVFDKRKAEKKSKELLAQNNYLNTLYSLDIVTDEFLHRSGEMLVGLCEWAKKYFKESPQASDDLIDFKVGSSDPEEEARIALTSVIDIEENILCPSLGLKGKIDASVNVKIHRRRKTAKGRMNSFRELEYLVPIELKTGKMFSKLGSIEHRAQAILYTLMLSEKHESEIEAGLLYYMKTGHLQGVPATLKEKRSLIMKRNEIARFLSIENQRCDVSMPGLLQNERICRRCPIVDTCMIFHKSVEKGNEISSGVGGLFEEKTGHVTENEMEYFVKWFRLLMLEAREDVISNGRKQVWTETSKERETNGKCFKDMVIQKETKTSDESWSYVFTKWDGDAYVGSLTDINITHGDRVMISEENCKTFGLCFGYVESVSKNMLNVWCGEKIRPRPQSGSKVRFRIEKDEGFSSQKIPLGNLMKLFLSRSDTDRRLRELIIGLAPPQFDLALSSGFLNDLCSHKSGDEKAVTYCKNGPQHYISSSQLESIRSVYKGLNPDQKEAVSRCLSAKDYVMVLGMPGTGKTTTIACIVSIILSLGMSVLITSYTHTAVDNILLKVKAMKLDFVRLGQQHKMHDDIKPFGVDNATRSIATVDELDRFYTKKRIVATTCLGMNHPLFLKKRFDFCIVDEASQITQPVCFGAIRYADAFILVGDQYQLPPLVQSVEARHSGIDVSLFKLLSEEHPSAIVSLRHQYRMHKDIMYLANDLIYGHRMQCGAKATATGLLHLPKFAEVKERYRHTATGAFLLRILEPSHPVVFINTDSVPCLEGMVGNHIHNEHEARLAALILNRLIECGAAPEDVGIICPLRQQLKTIEFKLKQICKDDTSAKVERNTVDKYQGRDKPCVIISFVRSNASRNVGELLKDWRRINVAVTRAKQKLILIGSKQTLSYSPVLSRLLNIIESKEWMVHLDESFLTSNV